LIGRGWYSGMVPGSFRAITFYMTYFTASITSNRLKITCPYMVSATRLAVGPILPNHGLFPLTLKIAGFNPFIILSLKSLFVGFHFSFS